MNKNHSSSIITVNNPSLTLELMYSIDKLDYNPNGLVCSEYLKLYWSSLGFNYKPFSTSNRQSGFICNNIGFLHQPHTSKYFYKIVSNPSHFKSYHSYKNILIETLPPELFSRIEIQTLDIACDVLNQNFAWLNERLVVARKQSIERILDSRGDETTRYFGKYPEVIRFYDKKKKVKKSQNDLDKMKIKKFKQWNRIEISQNSNRKLPTRNFDDLEKSLLDTNYNPFKSTLIQDFNTPHLEPESVKDFSSYKKYIQFETLVKANGFHYARRYFSRNDNFKRDFKKLFIDKKSICLGDYYHQGITQFLEWRL